MGDKENKPLEEVWVLEGRRSRISLFLKGGALQLQDMEETTDEVTSLISTLAESR